MHTNYETLHVETIDEHILLVMYDRPEVRNAKNTQITKTRNKDNNC